MKRVTIIILAVLTTACATPPRWVSAMYDNQDTCQHKNAQGQYPSYCGAGRSQMTIYSTPNQQPIGAQSGYIKVK